MSELCIDFQFSQNRSPLNGVYTPVTVPGTTDDDMELHVFNSLIRVWLDFKMTGAVLNQALEQASVGESVNRIISRFPGADLQLMTSGVDKVAYQPLGSHLFGVTQQIGAAWAYSIDGSGGGFDYAEGTHVFLFRSPPDASALEVLWQSSSLHLYVWQDTLKYKSGTPEIYVSSGLVVLDSTDYLLRVEYTATESNWYLMKLSDETVTSALGLAPLRSPNVTEVKMISTAPAPPVPLPLTRGATSCKNIRERRRFP